MRMSCNGCRVLRKGCSSDCSLRPCLLWIDSPESQANSTLFLARYYGRAGLLNLINSASAHLRPEIFRSLLYEACGRIVNPVYGSVGLLSSGDWSRCQDAVDAVLRGAAIPMPVSNTAALRNGDIRHLAKESTDAPTCRKRLKRSGSYKSGVDSVSAESALTEAAARFTITGWDCSGDYKDFIVKRAPSHSSGSVETVEPALFNRIQEPVPVRGEPEIGLDLSLGLNPVRQAYGPMVIEISDSET